MRINAGSLLKILNLEKQRGCADTAVFGGLDKFLVNWSAGAVETLTNPRVLRQFHKLFKAGYASMSREQRAKWIQEVFTFINDPESKDDKIAPPPKKAVPVPVKKKTVIKAAGPPAPVDNHALDAPVTVVKGISTALTARFGKMGVKTVRDLLYFFPHRHLDYSKLKTISQLIEGEEQTIVANVWQAQETRPGGRRSTEAIVGDETGNMRVVWFNQPYLAKTLTTNARIMLSGRVSLFKGRHVFQSPEWEIIEGQDFVHTARLVPVYPLTQGLRPRQVRRLMKGFIDQWADKVTDFLPAELRNRLKFLDLPEAIRQAHYPDDEKNKDKARTRLAFDELFLLQLGVMSQKAHLAGKPAGHLF